MVVEPVETQSLFFSKRFGKSGFGVFNFHSGCFNQVSIAKNFVACKIKSGWLWFWFSVSESCTSRTCPTQRATQRAPDWWESARFQAVCVA